MSLLYKSTRFLFAWSIIYFAGNKFCSRFRLPIEGGPTSNLGGRSTSVDHNAIRPPDRRHKYPSAYMSKHHGRDVRAADLKIRSATAAARAVINFSTLPPPASSSRSLSSLLREVPPSERAEREVAEERKKKERKKRTKPSRVGIRRTENDEVNPRLPRRVYAHIARCYICYDVIQEFDRTSVMTFRRN